MLALKASLSEKQVCYRLNIFLYRTHIGGVVAVIMNVGLNKLQVAYASSTTHTVTDYVSLSCHDRRYHDDAYYTKKMYVSI